MRVLIFPLKKELEYFKESLLEGGYKLCERVFSSGKKFWNVESTTSYLVEGGVGDREMALQVQKIIYDFKDVKSVMCVGSAGALKNNLNIGDVVVAVESTEFVTEVSCIKEARLKSYRASSSLIRDIKTHLKEFPFQGSVYFSNVLSVSESVISQKRARELSKRAEALAVAWEGAGAARACQLQSKPYLEVRVISDKCDPETSLDFTQNLKSAMEKSVSIFFHAI